MLSEEIFTTPHPFQEKKAYIYIYIYKSFKGDELGVK